MQICCTNPRDAVLECIVEGALNTLEVELFQETIQNAMDDTMTGLILECSQMPFLTSAGLRAV